MGFNHHEIAGRGPQIRLCTKLFLNEAGSNRQVSPVESLRMFEQEQI
jgi:hypothetical protein